MAASDARPVLRKNVAGRIYFPILDADGDLVSGASDLDSEVSLDGAAFADCTNEATEIGASGIYYLDLVQAETNADAIAVIVKTSTSGAKTTPMIFYPEEAGDVRVDVVQISGDAGAADNLEAAADGAGYNLGGGQIVAASVSDVAAGARQAIADDVLSRSAANVEGSAGEHTLCTVILAMLESSITGATWTIKRTDGSTTHATKAVTSDAAAEPITGVS